ncbi:PREDICTED: stAR-related lipid transfer protein 9 [Elephantulus edwardii]|uniref:stAR-related lipid transfer protein 9 n=1 Tax=Elephantulus edwardii TaxID=28737 RepID=UPI0003F0AE2A|nr:PREDICTED: stAR-related lipid transfer protein 9 [Elephantulus edwardii]
MVLHIINRETKNGERLIMEVDGKVAKIRNLKVDSRPDGLGNSREKVVTFDFDYCYWSVNPEDPQYASQDVVFQDLGTEVLSGASKGYNICLFAYGQTGSGKTYTMLGTPASVGLTPRICESLFIRDEDYSSCSLPSSCKIKVSFLEIYNERVRDLLKPSDQKKSYNLRVREHPEMGPYVQGLSQHVVTNYKQVIQLLEEGIANRITAATHVHEASSRSHAIFTIYYTQAILENSLPCEIASKINLVDLAGSERADPSYCKDRITEGANINKSLVTLGIVISTLAQNSQIFSSCQSLNSTASDGGDSGIPSSPSGTSSGGEPSRRQSYIPYRDSVLTWLLKDSLGGNSKTIMIATVSPAHTSYSETMSTLRYASNAKNIINKPRVNEDANVKLIRELREEIERLKAMLLSFELRNFNALKDEKDDNMTELVVQNEMKIDQLTKDWMQKWSDWKALMENYSVDINRRRAGLVIDSSLPHLMALEDDVLSTSVVLYHLKEGTTKIGRIDSDQEQDIVLQGQWIQRDHCTITCACGVVILRPSQGARCTVNGREVTTSCRLTQGAVITLGKAHKFRFNHPAEAAALRRRRQAGEAIGGIGSLEWLDLDGYITASRLGLHPLLWEERRVLGEQSEKDHLQPKDGETSHRVQIQHQQLYVEDLRQQILTGQLRAEQELEFDQAHINQQIEDNQKWLLREETWLAGLQQQQQNVIAEKEREPSLSSNAWLQADSETQPSPLVQSQKKVVQLQLLRRHAVWAAEQNIRQKKATFQLERIIKKQRLLEAQKSLEQLKVLYWLQDDNTQEAPDQVPSIDVPGPRRRSKSTSCSSLSLQRLCSQYLPQPHSVILQRDPCPTALPVPDPTHQRPEDTLSEEHLPHAASYPLRMRTLSRNDFCGPGQEQMCTTRGTRAMKTSIPCPCLTMNSMSPSFQEMGRIGKQPYWKMSQGSASLNHPANKLKARLEPEALTSQKRKAKRITGSGSIQAEWCKEGNLVHRVVKGTGCSFPYPREHRQTSGCGKAAKTFWAESKPVSPNKAPKRQQKVLAARIRNTAKKPPHWPHGSPLKRQHRAWDPNIMAPVSNSILIGGLEGENDNDFSDINSDYSADSLSCVYAQTPVKILKPEDPNGEELDLPEPDNSESDDSQISQDSLVEREHQSPEARAKGRHHMHGPRYHGAPIRASGRHFTKPSAYGLLFQAHRSFSLDSLNNAVVELGEDQQEKAFRGSLEEMPTETFWHLQNPGMSVVSEEAAGNSFYLTPLFQPQGGPPDSAVEKASSLSGVLPSRGSPLMSMDSWFSCDSKINPSNPPGTVGSLCPSPDVQEFQSCGWEKPESWQNRKELKPSDTEAVLPNSFGLLQGSAELGCGASDGYTIPTSDTSRLSFWETHSPFQPGVDGTCQRRVVPDTSQESTSETSNSSSMSNVLAASAASFTHVGSACDRDWSALQQKYLLELSHPVLEAVVEPTLAFPCLEEDSHALTQATARGGESLLPAGPGVSSSLDFNSSIHLSKSRCLRAEKEQDGLGVKLEDTTNFCRASENKVSYNETSSTESLTSRTTNVPVFSVESKVPNLMVETCEVKQNNLKMYCQDSRKPGLMPSSEESFFLKNTYHSNGSIATKDHWPQCGSSLRKTSENRPGRPQHNSRCPLQKDKGDCQRSSKDRDFSIDFLSDPELCPHSAPGDPVSSSLQPPPLETFYVTKSRDALTETALEIPACRKARVPAPPVREAWGTGPDHQVLCTSYVKNNLPMPLQDQSSKIASSQQIAVERPVDLNTREGGKESYKTVSFSVVPHRHLFSSTSSKVYEFENQVEIVNKCSLLACKEKREATTEAQCNVSSDSSVSGKPLLVCESGEESQDQNAVLRQSQAFAMNRQLYTGPRSDFICETINLGLENNMLEEMTISLKSRSVDHSASSSVIAAQEEIHTHRWEGKNETMLLRKARHPQYSSDELKLLGADSVYERFQTVPSSHGRKPSDCKQPEKSQERATEETSGKKQNKSINNDDEMARLIRSVVQLEHSVLEMESKLTKQLHRPRITGVSEEIVFLDEEKAGCVLRPGSPAEHVSFRDSISYTKQQGDVILRDSRVGEMKEFSSWMGKEPQVQRPFTTTGCVEEILFVREPSYPDVFSRSARGTWDYTGTDTAHRESSKRGMTASTRAQPLQPRQERSSTSEGELLNASASPRGQPHDTRRPEELETVKDFQKSKVGKHISSSMQKGLKVQRRIEEMIMQMRGSLEEDTKMISSVQKLASPRLLCMSRFFSQETMCPVISQTDSATTSSHQDLTNTLPLNSPSLPRNCFRTPDTAGIFSVDYMLDPTVFKIRDSPLVARREHEDQNGDIRGHVRGITSVTHTAWCEPAVSMMLDTPGQSRATENVSLWEEGRMAANTTPQDRGSGLINTFMDLNARESFALETGAIQKEIKRTSSQNSSHFEKTINSPLEESDFQVKEMKQKTGNDAFSVPASLTNVPPSPESTKWEPSAHASFCLALLEEVRQAKAQGKQLTDCVAKRTVFPSQKTLPELECSSEVSGRPQNKQVGQSVSDRTRKEGEAQGFHRPAQSAELGCLLTNEKTVLQATPLSAESSQPLSNLENHSGALLPSLPATPALGNSHCPGEPRPCLGVSEQFKCHSGSSEIPEKMEEATRKFSLPGPLGSDCLLSSSAVEEDRRVELEKAVPALSSQVPSDNPGVTQDAPCWLAVSETVADLLPESQESHPEPQEPRSLDSTYGGGSGNFLVTTQAGKPTYFERHCVPYDARSSTDLSVGPEQDYAQSLEASTDLEDGKVNLKTSGSLRPGALRRAKLEDPSQQCANQKGSVRSWPAETCTFGSRYLKPSSSPIPQPNPAPGVIEEKVLSKCPKGALDCIVSASIEGNRTPSPYRGHEESRPLLSLGLCGLPPVSSHASSLHSSTLLGYGSGDPEKAAPNTVPLPCIVPSRTCGMDERGAGCSLEPDVLLAHGLKPKDNSVELGAAGGRTQEPSATAAVFPLTQSCTSAFAPDKEIHPLAHSTADGSSSSAEEAERKSVEKKGRRYYETLLPIGMCAEPPRKHHNSCAGGQNSQTVHMKRNSPATSGGFNTRNSHEESALNILQEPQHGYLENTPRYLPEKQQEPTEFRNHSSLDFQSKFVASLKHFQSTRVDSPWEEEEQQRDEASGDGKNPAPSDADGLDSQSRHPSTNEEAVSKPERVSSDMEDFVSVHFGPSGPQPPGQRLDQRSSGREQSSHGQDSVPVIAIFSGPKHSLRTPPRPLFSVVSSSRSLQELNLSVEPPPTDKDILGPNRLWNPHLNDCCSGELAARNDLEAKGSCIQKASPNWDSRKAGHGPMKPATLPYPASPALSYMPGPDCVPGTQDVAQEGRSERLGPEEWFSGTDRKMLHFDLRGINPSTLPWRTGGPGCISWKQYVFDSAVDGRCSQTATGVIPSNVALCSSIDHGLEDQRYPFPLHLSARANAWDLSRTHSSTENACASDEAMEIWGSSFALGYSHPNIGTERGEKRFQLKDASDEASIKSKAPLLEGDAAGPVDEILLLYPSATDSTLGQAKRCTIEQGTQTLSCRPHWSCTDVASGAPELSAASVCHLASWTSMHSLSLHLSQLLHSTSELLESLSQPNAAEKEQKTREQSPGAAPQLLRTDGCTQTAVDKGSQTDLCSQPLLLRALEANPQEVNVILEMLDSETLTMSQEKGFVSVALEKKRIKETARSPDLQEENIHCRSQRPSSHLKFQKDSLGQELPSVSTQYSLNMSVPPSSQQDTCSCLGVSSPGLTPSQEPVTTAAESVEEPRLQKEQPGLMSTLVVDRASSPILTLSPKQHSQPLRPNSTQRVATCLQSSGTLPSPMLRSRDWELAKSLVPEGMVSPKCDPQSDRSGWPSRTENGGKSSSPVESQPMLDVSSPWRDLRHPSPCPVSGLTNTTGLRDSALGPAGACQPEELLSSTPQKCMAPESAYHSLRDLPVHNKSRNWCGVQDDCPAGLGVAEMLGTRCDLHPGGQGEKLSRSEGQSQTPKRPQCEQIPLQVGSQNLTLSMELTEAKLYHGFGETDALLQMLQSGTGEALAAEEPELSTTEPVPPTWEELYVRQKKAIETLWRDRAERRKTFSQRRSPSPQKQLSLLPNMDFPKRALNLPSRRREYLQQLRKDVVETTRQDPEGFSPPSVHRRSESAHLPSDIELMLRDYQQAREEAKMEIAQARNRLRERTEREKLKIRQQIVSQLLREKEKLHTLANSSPLCTSSSGSLSSAVTSGYNSIPALFGQLQSPDSLGDTNLSDSRDTWIGDSWGHSEVRQNRLYRNRASTGSCSCSPSSLSSTGTCFSSSYQDLAKHIVHVSMADVMAACSDNLHNLFMGQAAAGWTYQGEEQQVQLYYKVFSSTRHGFLGAGVVPQPLAQVWTAVSDPTLWPLYHKPIQTARLHQRVTSTISLVYLVCSTTLCALKQPRDFCCVCVEAKEGQMSIMAAQSVYDTSMPRPSREMVRGEILPSAWILQPLTVEGKEMTRVIYLAQVELGAPGFPPQLLNSFIKQQPLVIARLESFLSS